VVPRWPASAWPTRSVEKPHRPHRPSILQNLSAYMTATDSPNQPDSQIGLISSLEVVVIVSHKLNAGPLHVLVSRGGAFSSRLLSQHARARGLNPNYPIVEFSAKPD